MSSIAFCIKILIFQTKNINLKNFIFYKKNHIKYLTYYLISKYLKDDFSGRTFKTLLSLGLHQLILIRYNY